ncbi:5-formyltetrahydrofolate cyclo-ligase [Clostridium sp.]|uniref:5-formyltetrahydrofolate cyclo-ligase n=1 Tax=Clostridium sp. TaxID=1506 RepID=UPI002587C466|nr:5-formyltetrahydrofolate cyclo-ligase [Clostridium sp.]MDF2503649.1 5,10-methenyltetrahydrofolate synthetase [Clostridium sp.]
MWVETSKTKSEFRNYITKKRNELSLTEKSEKDNAIYEAIINSELFIKAKMIFIYISFGNEVDTHKIIEKALSLGKEVCVPKVISRLKGMRALKINSLNNLKVSDYGVLEPEDNSEEVFAKDMNLAIIPGLVFDLKGGRIGYGGGFYDRFFSNTNIDITKIALAYQFQILEELPLEDQVLIIVVLSEGSADAVEFKIG